MAFLRRAIEVSRRSREHGNTPFGAILVDEHKNVVLEQENREVTEHICAGHAETSLMEAASRKFDHDYLWQCTIYTTGEPCAMCSGAIYWANVGRVVYAMTERDILAQTSDNEQNPTLDPLPPDLRLQPEADRGRRPLPRARRRGLRSPRGLLELTEPRTITG